MRENPIRSFGRGAAIATIMTLISLGEGARAASPTNPILFVTQVPLPEDFTTVVSAFGNQSGAVSSALCSRRC